jgi:phosphoenolpyruvate carboxykinase (ATP)
VSIPRKVPGVPSAILSPRTTWDDPTAYDEGAAELAGMFAENFEKYSDAVSPAVRTAGPQRETALE